MNPNSFLVCAITASLLLVAGCDKQRDEPPAAAPLPPSPPVTEPVVAAPAPPAESAAAPAVVAPRIGVAKGAPEGVVVGLWVAGGQCNLEYYDKELATAEPFTLKSGGHLVITGWALDPKFTVAPDAVHVRFLSADNVDYFGTISKRVVRNDVNGLHRTLAKNTISGYELEFDADQLPPGTYSLQTVIVVGDKTYICDNGRKVTRAP